MSRTRPPFTPSTGVQASPVAGSARCRVGGDVSPDGSQRTASFGAASQWRSLFGLLSGLPVAAAVVLVPWTVGLATLLPHRSVAYHWNVAWTGLDVGIATGLALTGWLSRRHETGAALAAVATAALMCTDAWFDLCTSAPGPPFAFAAVEAVAELAVAAGCLAIGLRSRSVAAANVSR